VLVFGRLVFIGVEKTKQQARLGEKLGSVSEYKET
jgi:hypothetical protein